MRQLLTILLLLAAAAGSEPSGMTAAELAERARAVAKLRNGSSEFQAHLTFKLFGIAAVPIDGRMEFARRPSGQWHRELSIPNYFREIDNSGDEVIYKDRTTDYEPLSVGQVYELFSVAVDPHPDPELKWGKPHAAANGNCVGAKVHIHTFEETFEERWCFNSAGALTDVEMEPTRLEFSEFQTVQGHLVPTLLRLYYKKKLAVEARAKWDFASELQDDLFKPSAGAVDWPVCRDMVPPKEEYAPDPVYPRRAPGVTGDDAEVLLYVTVAADGKLRMPYVIESGGPAFDAQAVAAIRDWKFHPASCGGKSVPVQTRVDVRFRYGRGGPNLPMYR